MAQKFTHLRLLHKPFLIFALLLVSGCDFSEPERTWKSIPVHNGTLQIRVVAISGPAGFAPHTLRFYYASDQGDKFLGTTFMHNDGASLSDQNIEVTQPDKNRWKVTLKGQEQKDEHWQLTFAASRPVLEQLSP